MPPDAEMQSLPAEELQPEVPEMSREARDVPEPVHKDTQVLAPPPDVGGSGSDTSEVKSAPAVAAALSATPTTSYITHTKNTMMLMFMIKGQFH